jgi:hypothetical protein
LYSDADDVWGPRNVYMDGMNVPLWDCQLAITSITSRTLVSVSARGRAGQDCADSCTTERRW